MDEVSRATRFLSAFAEIEKHFRARFDKGDNRLSFIRMAELYALGNRAQRDLPALRTFADLRNALAHQDYYEGKPVAEPVSDVVNEIERLRDRIIRPPAVLNVLERREIKLFRPEDKLRDVLEVIRQHDYSQFPVYHEDAYAGLLTTNCIARWLAHRLATDELVEEETVGNAMEFHEPQDHAIHLGRDATVPQALKKLAPATGNGQSPAALIITHSGIAQEKPLAIVVAGDIPSMVASLDVRS
ncbi:CBS domain-containing protein [Rhodococcus sp. NPDC058532]|uniref:CBS domain-containing protein n=1 Tax=Rhodococcus sp. NPDC058532 TaxID=3346540 RepID=UPI00364A69D7